MRVTLPIFFLTLTAAWVTGCREVAQAELPTIEVPDGAPGDELPQGKVEAPRRVVAKAPPAAPNSESGLLASSEEKILSTETSTMAETLAAEGLAKGDEGLTNAAAQVADAAAVIAVIEEKLKESAIETANTPASEPTEISDLTETAIDLISEAADSASGTPEIAASLENLADKVAEVTARPAAPETVPMPTPVPPPIPAAEVPKTQENGEVQGKKNDAVKDDAPEIKDGQGKNKSKGKKSK